jgi:excinuclease ABC subunit C
VSENYQNLPNVPGVYLFKKDGLLLYVGKAKSLRKRVQTYFNKREKDWKIDALLSEYTTIEHIATKTEIEAELLEAQLIKEHQPKYNVLLKSGQPFVYILFTKGPLPELLLVRNKKIQGTYFGPFLHKQKARSAYRYLIETFRLYLCHKKISNGCLHYHLGVCAGMCLDTFDQEGYLFRLRLAQELLKGHYAASLRDLNAQIKAYTKALEFEKAQNLHHYAQNLESIFQTLKAKFSQEVYEKEAFLVTAPPELTALRTQEAGQQLQQLFHLPAPPHTIDCFDVSHFQGRQIVGSCIRFTNGIPDKNKFRRFKIRLEQQNDYAALQEIVQRRYKDPAEIPDLILVDGGKGQLSAVREVLPHAQIVALAKREERVFSAATPEGIILDLQTPVGKLLIALRDYAHHFAISYHKKRRLKEF